MGRTRSNYTLSNHAKRRIHNSLRPSPHDHSPPGCSRDEFPLSPYTLPLFPGHLSYAAGMSRSNKRGNGGDSSGVRHRALFRAVFFTLELSAVFVSFGATFGSAGNSLLEQQAIIAQVLGAVTIVMGLAFLGVFEYLALVLHSPPSWVFRLSSGTAWRGEALALAYSAGLGAPFNFASFAFERAMKVLALARKHTLLITRIGAGMLTLIGFMQVTGLWGFAMSELRSWMAGYAPAL
ncbi:cytochrome c biogenesis CcdA family protein [Streptomyces sp. NPDC091027]|uniref:cytochrome c biogenesis CcdA family protein n=1 Tax=Streptomyces sp. NPDC091027 TaxID=3365971 RepID=UPI003829D018